MGNPAGSFPVGRFVWPVAPERAGAAAWPGVGRFIRVLLVVFVVKQIFLVAAFYPFSGHDELAHFSYVRTLVNEGRVPELPDLAAWRSELDGGAPPPTDLLPAELYKYCRYTLDWFCQPNSVRWRDNPPRIVTVPGLGYFPSGYQYVANHPPLYYALMAPLYALSSSLPPVGQHYLLRLAAIPFGLLAVYAAYRATRALFPGDAFLTVTVPTLVAFQPQISYEAAMVNNDIVAIALTSVVIWALIVGIRDRFPRTLCVTLGVLLGLDLIAKSTALAIAPVIALAVVLAVGWRDWRGVLGKGIAIGATAAIVAGPWYLYLYRTYGDFSGLARVDALQYWNSPMGSFFELLTDPGFVLARFRETWGEFGWRLIHLRPELLWAIAIPTVAGLLGLVVYAITAWRGAPIWRGDNLVPPADWQAKALVVLGCTCVVAYLAVVEFGTSFALSQARYFFPAVGAASILTMLGLRALIPPRARSAGQGIIVAALIALNLVIMVAYVLPFTVTVDQPIVNWTWGG